jgi:tRNA A37 threonylcarbamoyladenosine biosynthesis protein TsaE
MSTSTTPRTVVYASVSGSLGAGGSTVSEHLVQRLYMKQDRMCSLTCTCGIEVIGKDEIAVYHYHRLHQIDVYNAEVRAGHRPI